MCIPHSIHESSATRRQTGDEENIGNSEGKSGRIQRFGRQKMTMPNIEAERLAKTPINATSLFAAVFARNADLFGVGFSVPPVREPC
jgi:hypothetical protein